MITHPTPDGTVELHHGEIVTAECLTCGHRYDPYPAVECPVCAADERDRLGALLDLD